MNRIELYENFVEKKQDLIIKEYLVLFRGPIIMLGKGHDSKHYTRVKYVTEMARCIALDILDKHGWCLEDKIKKKIRALLKTKHKYDDVPDWDHNVYDILDPIWRIKF